MWPLISQEHKLAEWLSRTRGDVSAQGGPEKAFLSPLIQEHWIRPFQTETEENLTRNIKGDKYLRKAENIDSTKTFFVIYAEGSNLPRKSKSLQSTVHCRLTNVCHFTCQHTHLSALHLPMKSLGHAGGCHSPHKIHQAVAGLTQEIPAPKWCHSCSHARNPALLQTKEKHMC